MISHSETEMTPLWRAKRSAILVLATKQGVEGRDLIANGLIVGIVVLLLPASMTQLETLFCQLNTPASALGCHEERTYAPTDEAQQSLGAIADRQYGDGLAYQNALCHPPVSRTW
jgi:hypothetical protein